MSRVIRVAKDDYYEVISLAFSYDNWSHLLAIFNNGVARIYSLKGKAKEIAPSCPYIGSFDDEIAAIDLTEICYITCEHIMTDQDKFIQEPQRELGIVCGNFHPAFNLFGLQKSIIIAANSIFS